MKKIACLVLSVLMLIGLFAGCAVTDDNAGNGQD